MQSNKEKIAVIVGRFQVAELTQGHMDLFNEVISSNYGSILLILGLAPVRCTQRNPLDFESRRLMFEEKYPGKFNIQYLKDCADDELWSVRLDEMVDDIRGNRDVVFIGSRDCFYSHYFGKYKENFVEYTPKVYVSGSEQRKSLSKQIKTSSQWRAGCIYATSNQYPSVFASIDCAIFWDETLDKICLARKKDEKFYRFVGGFSSPDDTSFEHAAKREAAEETKLEANIIGYIGSTKIDDWRYRSEVNKIITVFYAMVKAWGRAEPSDDINELHVVDFDTLNENNFVKEHVVLFDMLKEWREQYLKNHINFKKEIEKQID